MNQDRNDNRDRTEGRMGQEGERRNREEDRGQQASEGGIQRGYSQGRGSSFASYEDRGRGADDRSRFGSQDRFSDLNEDRSAQGSNWMQENRGAAQNRGYEDRSLSGTQVGYQSGGFYGGSQQSHGGYGGQSQGGFGQGNYNQGGFGGQGMGSQGMSHQGSFGQGGYNQGQGVGSQSMGYGQQGMGSQSMGYGQQGLGYGQGNLQQGMYGDRSSSGQGQQGMYGQDRGSFGQGGYGQQGLGQGWSSQQGIGQQGWSSQQGLGQHGGSSQQGLGQHGMGQQGWSGQQGIGQSLQQQRGAMRGRGPLNYTRSDSRIYEDVCDALSDDDQIDASQVEVKVEKGEVTLTGSVDSRDTKRHIEDALERVSGVKEINNQIKVQRASTGGGRPQGSGTPNVEH